MDAALVCASPIDLGVAARATSVADGESRSGATVVWRGSIPGTSWIEDFSPSASLLLRKKKVVDETKTPKNSKPAKRRADADKDSLRTALRGGIGPLRGSLTGGKRQRDSRPPVGGWDRSWHLANEQRHDPAVRPAETRARDHHAREDARVRVRRLEDPRRPDAAAGARRAAVARVGARTAASREKRTGARHFASANMSTHALATAGPCRVARCLADAGASRGIRARSDAPGFGARGALARPARGAFRRFAPSRGTPTTVARASNGPGRSEHDEDAARARDAAAASGRLAPLDVKTLVGAELELIMKADPLAFERALADQVRPRPPTERPFRRHPRRKPLSHARGRERSTKVVPRRSNPSLAFVTRR